MVSSKHFGLHALFLIEFPIIGNDIEDVEGLANNCLYIEIKLIPRHILDIFHLKKIWFCHKISASIQS